MFRDELDALEGPVDLWAVVVSMGPVPARRAHPVPQQPAPQHAVVGRGRRWGDVVPVYFAPAVYPHVQVPERGKKWH